MLPTFLLLNHITIRRRHLRKTMKTIKNAKNNLDVDVCRTCLSIEGLIPIFFNKEYENKLSEDLRLVTGLEVKLNDGLSQKICNQCVGRLQAALQFRRTSRKSEKTLLEMLCDKSKEKTYKSKPSRILKKCIEELDTDIVNNADEDYAYDLNGDFHDETDLYSNNEYEDSKATPVKIEQKVTRIRRKRDMIPNAASYKCSTCGKEFKMKTTYKAHLRFHTNYCVCEACGKRCRNSTQLQEHKRARHGLGRIHKCAYCEYSSATKEALIIHERRHTGERPYICDHCGATFHRRSNLVQHIAIHLPDKNFQCAICLKREKSRKLLQVHVYKCHKEKQYRYICPVCKETFARPSNVRRHLTRAHYVPRERQGQIERFQVHSRSLPLIEVIPTAK